MARTSISSPVEPMSPREGSPRDRLQAAKLAVTRSLIVDGAISAFDELGYARTTVRDIAERAGVTRVTFYKYFSSKSAVMPELQAILEEHWTPLYDDLAAVITEPTVPLLRHWLLTAFDAWQQLAGVSKARNEAAALHPDLYDVVHYREEVNANKIARVLETTGSSREDAAIQAVALLAPLNQYLRIFLERTDFDRERTADVLARMWVSGVGSRRG